MVSTPLENISHLGSLFPIDGKTKNVPNHQPALKWMIWRYPYFRNPPNEVTPHHSLSPPDLFQLRHSFGPATAASACASGWNCLVSPLTIWTTWQSSLQVYGGFHKWRYPNSWMVYNGKSKSQMDENWGIPHDLGNHHMGQTRMRFIMFASQALAIAAVRRAWRFNVAHRDVSEFCWNWRTSRCRKNGEVLQK